MSMFRYFLIATILFSFSAGAAEEIEGHTPEETCKRASEIAEKIMMARQKGMPMADAIDVAGESSIIKGMVIKAYKSPRFSTEEYMTRASIEFGNRAYVGCADAIMK